MPRNRFTPTEGSGQSVSTFTGLGFYSIVNAVASVLRWLNVEGRRVHAGLFAPSQVWPMKFMIGLLVFCACEMLSGGSASASIHPGDQLSIRIFNHPEISSDAFRVDSRGSVDVPIIGSVAVVGLEPRQVAGILEHRFAPFIPYPAIDVRDATESAVIFVAGGPGGVLTYSPGETLATAIAEVEKTLQASQTVAASSSNITDQLDRSRIDTRRVLIVRDNHTLGSYNLVDLRQTGDPGPALLPDDTVSFADKPVVVTVLGDVAQPGRAYLWDDEPLSDALVQAGGLRDSAAAGHIQLSRIGESPRSVALGDEAFTVPAHQGDTVTFPMAPRVTVAGMVTTPGVVTLKNNFTLLSAMYTAGGINKWANIKDVQVLHRGAVTHYDVTLLTHGDLAQNPILVDGDTVFVPEGHRIDFTAVFGPLLSAGNILTRF